MSAPSTGPGNGGEVRLAGLTLASRVLVASGCGGTGRELAAYGDLGRLGGFVTRSVTLEARPGGPLPRIAEAPAGLLNATGLPNPGLDRFLAAELPAVLSLGARVFVSIAAATISDYAELGRRLATTPGLAGIEVNLAAPDAAGSGLLDAGDPHQAALVVEAVHRHLPQGLPVLAKLRSDVGRVGDAARSVARVGAAGVVVGNAVPAALPDRRWGGLSGPAIRPVMLRCVAEAVAAAPDLDVVACGGISTVADVRAALAAGARAVQVGTALLHDPTTCFRLTEELGAGPRHPEEAR